MGLFTSLFSSKVSEQPSGKNEVAVLMGIGNFDMEIAGTAHYQAALEAICGPRLSNGVNRFETACLILDDKNRVRVEIRRKLVGYLSPENAGRYGELLKARGTPKARGQCQAAIRGGWVSSDGRKGPYHVWLDLLMSQR
ncbi:MAG TPA: hypothetical protein VJ821_05050 [Anaerolineales bacterium]|nr:hypothetical protein [Anaerolineales bacterium]